MGGTAAAGGELLDADLRLAMGVEGELFDFAARQGTVGAEILRHTIGLDGAGLRGGVRGAHHRAGALFRAREL